MHKITIELPNEPVAWPADSEMVLLAVAPRPVPVGVAVWVAMALQGDLPNDLRDALAEAPTPATPANEG